MRVRHVLPLLALALAGCGGAASGRDGERRVVATTGHLADIARNVAGDRAEVEQLIPAGADAHDYELRPRDVRALSRASVVVRSGGDVDDWLAEAIGAAGGDAPVLTVLDRVAPIPDDPHWWHDPRRAVTAAQAIRDALIRADPAGRQAYARNAAAYTDRLRALDRAIARCVARIPLARRRLVTTHDALGYYAQRYGFRVVGTVIPARSTQAQASSRDTAELIAAIRRERVRAIFTEASTPGDLERTIAEATGARVGEPLLTDALGEPGSAGATYAGSLAHNTRAIVAGSGADPADCAGLD